MQESKSIFFPIQAQVSDQKIFAKRHTLYKKSFNGSFKAGSAFEDKQIPSKTKDTYSSFKRKLEDYILKEKDRHSMQKYSGEPQLNHSKYRIIFRKRHSTQHSKTNKSTIFFPSDQMKHSFSQLLISSESKQKTINVISAQFCLKDRNPANKKLNHETNSQDKRKTHIRSTTSSGEHQSDFTRSMKPLFAIFQAHRLRKKDINSAASNSDKSIFSRALTTQSQTEVIVCRGSNYTDIDELQHKKHELSRINQELKSRNAVKFRLRKRTQQQKGNDVGPWSKTLPLDEDEM